MVASPTPITGSSSSDTINLSKLGSGVTYDGGAGDDFITGSSGADVIRGGSGNDRIQGGAGNDTYVFVAGDLSGSLAGGVDHIIDFQGAGSNAASGYQDQIAFYGYSANTRLVFDHYGADRVQSGSNLDGSPKYVLVPNLKLQYYKVVDDSDHSRDGYILVQMQDGTSQLTASDYTFNRDAITGTATGDVTEAGGLDNAEPGVPTATGKLTATTFDQATSFKAVDPSALSGKYGSFTFASDGSWSYTLDNTKAATEALKTGQTETETLNVQTLDGTMQTLTVSVHGTDDVVPNTPATIGGTDTGTVKEDVTLSAMGQLSITDPDAGQSAFVVHGASNPLPGAYGSLTIDGSGAWTYSLDNTKAQPLKVGQVVQDTITVTSIDGTTRDITIAVNGTNDAPTGSATATLPDGTEDMSYTVSKAALLTGFSDVDGDALSIRDISANHDGYFSPVVDNLDGTYTIRSSDNYNGPVTLTYTVSDDHNGEIRASQSFMLAPVNDAPTVAVDTNSITEKQITVTGNVLTNDRDVDGDSLTATLASGGTHYGTLSLFLDGSYVYTLSQSSAAVNALNNGQSLKDTFTYAASDGQGGTAQSTLTITINGVTDATRLPGTVTHFVGDDNTNNNYTEQAEAVWGSGATTTNAYTGDVVSIAGLTRDIDTYDGMGRTDTISGKASSDALIYDTSFSADVDSAGTPVGTAAAFVRIEQFFMSAGNDVLNLTSGSNGSQSYNGATNLQGGLGNDVIWGGGANEIILGENNVYTSGPKGNDFLHGGAGNDTLFGDGRSVGKGVVLGDDVIDGGTGDDLMFGDGRVFGQDFTGTRGHNTFRFDGPGSGKDTIGAAPSLSSFFFNGYQHGLDHLQLSAKYGFTAAQALARTADNVAGNAVVDLGNGDTITLYGVHKADLTASDFIIG